VSLLSISTSIIPLNGVLSNQKIGTGQIQQNDFFQTIANQSNNSSFPQTTASVPNLGDFINTSVDEITPYEQTESPLIITATGPSDLSNVSLFYKYSADNTTRLYATAMNEVSVKTSALNYPNAITSVNGIGFIASYLTNSLVIYDVTNSSNIKFISSKNDAIRTKHIESTEATHDGKYCYTLTRNGFGNSVISMYNASDLYALSLMNYKFLPATCQGMYLEMDEEEEFLYATGDYYICIYNITDKASGQLNYVGEIDLKGVLPKGIIWKIHIVGNTLYAPCGYHSNTSMGWKGLRIYNITDRVNPTYANSLNWTTTYGWDCQIFTHTNGFHYLVFAGISQLTPYRRAKVNLYNVSAGNATHPEFMYTMNICDPGGNCSNSFGVVYHDYLFLRNENKNHTSNPNWNTGFWVFNLTNINNPTNLTRLYGDGAPNYLEALHYIEGDKNGSARSVYMLSMTDDALAVINPTWMPAPMFDSQSYQFGIPDTYPYSWSFNFPNGTGFYEFYSIGQKSGLPPEAPPSSPDAITQYLIPQIDFNYTPQYPTIYNNVLFSDTSIIPDGWVINWNWDFGDGNGSIEQNPIHRYTKEGAYNVTLIVNHDQEVVGITIKTIEINHLKLQNLVIIGKTANVQTENNSISFRATNIILFSFSPFSFERYNSGETFVIPKNYLGFLGTTWVFILCSGALLPG
jgi:hypothetical protein